MPNNSDFSLSFWIRNDLSWKSTLEAARVAQGLGYRGIWFADHFMPNAPEPVDGAMHEAFALLAAVAATVPDVRIGPMVAGNTYRHPAVLAKIAATIDEISEGRAVLGLGAGWQENEHKAYGMEFNNFGWRFDRLEESCQIIRSLFDNQRTTFAGKHFQIENAPLDPKPVQSRLPILLGGGGEKRTLSMVAKYADEWNVWGTPEVLAAKGAILDAHCASVGRDPSTVHRTAVALMFLIDDQATVEKMRSRDIGRPSIIGNPEQVAEILRAYKAAGVSELIIPDFTFADAEARETTLRRLMTEVMPLV